ncbi:hypothetical protein EV360DRAFT_74140 [Lentinula raphanica]|nr:hypothetical protein EV360DRAFT_74140 [Lentinula raphanica]
MNAIAWISGYRSSGYTGWNLRQYTELYVGNPHMVAYIFCSDANTLPGAIKLKFKFRPRGRGRERRTSKPQTVLKKEKRGARDPSKLKFEATQRRRMGKSRGRARRKGGKVILSVQATNRDNRHLGKAVEKENESGKCTVVNKNFGNLSSKFQGTSLPCTPTCCSIHCKSPDYYSPPQPITVPIVQEEVTNEDEWEPRGIQRRTKEVWDTSVTSKRAI